MANPLAYDMIFVALGVRGLMLGWLPPRNPEPAMAALIGGGTLPTFCARWARAASLGR